MDWEFVFVLPNLVMPDKPGGGRLGQWPGGLDLATDAFVIVPMSDPRVAVAREASAPVDQLCSGFRTVTGQPYAPSVLMARSDAPDGVRLNLEAIVAFRNAIALSIVLPGRAAIVRSGSALSPTWSDTFDFHPAQIGGTGSVVIQSPAHLSALRTSKDLLFTQSPYVPTEGWQLRADAYLYRVLGAEWRRRYMPPARDDQFSGSLFRSLQVAYTACSVGAKNEGSIHDYGLNIALWVSAIEILAWPAAEHADFENVLGLLARYPLRRPLARRRYFVKLRKKDKPRRLNALERAYSYLYRARNAFLHGNPVSPAILFTRSRAGPVSLPSIAAIVYRAALASYLNSRYKLTLDCLDDLRDIPSELFEGANYSDALAEAFGIEL